MKIKLLLFVSEFWQAGTQRFTFELHTGLDKERYDISMLSYHPLEYEKNRADYYYTKHRNLNASIFFLADINASKQKSWFRNNSNSSLNNFLDGFDIISFMGEYTYAGIQSKLSEKIKKKSVIHIMNSKYQFPNIYDKYKKDEAYVFCSGFNNVEIKNELSDFNNYKHYFFPLSINIKNTEPIWKPTKNTKKKIGIFTRITNTKPLDPFLYAFHLLQNHSDLYELNIYGNSDEYIATVKQMLNYLGIENKTKIHGHVDDIKQTALEHELDIVWFHSFYGSPGGFAGYDMASIGLPQLFWNFTNSEFDEFIDGFPVFSDILLFVESTKQYLEDQTLLLNLSKTQFQKIVETRNIHLHIPLIDEMYLDILKNQDDK